MLSPERGFNPEDLAQTGHDVEIKMAPVDPDAAAREEAERLSPPSNPVVREVGRTQAGHDVEIKMKPTAEEEAEDLKRNA